MNLNVANEKLDRSDVLTLQVAEASTLQLSLARKNKNLCSETKVEWPER